jgi:tRNA threonylcarbamoyladenosine biosynthesis protein TsaE
VILDAPLKIELATPEAAERLGARIARLLAPGDAVLLKGELGAGKSTLARGLVRALTSPDEEVPSPTFTLVQAYEGPEFPIAHLDLYRLSGPDEVYELGFDEALEAGAVLVEWPQRLGARLPPDRLDIELRLTGAGGPDEGRLAVLEPHGSFRGRVLDE